MTQTLQTVQISIRTNMFFNKTKKDITYSFENLNQIISEVTAKIDIPEGVFVEKVFGNGLHGIRIHRQGVERVISTVLNNALSCVSENGINELLYRKIIEDQRGRIEFFNDPSRGNCVAINFPL